MVNPLKMAALLVAGASMPFASPQAISDLGLRNAPKAGAQSAQSLNVTPTNANQTTPAPVGQTNISPDWVIPTIGTISSIASVCLTAMVVKCLRDYCNRRQNATGNQDAGDQRASAQLVYPIDKPVIVSDEPVIVSDKPVILSDKPQPPNNVLDVLYGKCQIKPKPQFAPDSTIGDVKGLQLSRTPSSVSV